MATMIRAGATRVRARASRRASCAPRSVAVVASAEVSAEPSWVPVLKAEDLPKGARKLLSVKGAAVLVFWYKSDIFCIEARSPAEGAYSEGFLNARFTQDGCIECPTTGTTFDLKTGAVKDWYPNNPVLRRLTPGETCRPMLTYPVKPVDEDGIIYIDEGSVEGGRIGDGGASSSLENNNVFSIEPSVYLEDGSELNEDDAGLNVKPATLIAGITAAGIVGTAGTAVCLYYENLAALAAFWVVGFGVAAAVALQVTGANK